MRGKKKKKKIKGLFKKTKEIIEREKGSTLFKIAKKKKKHRLHVGDVYISIFFHIFVKKFYQKSPMLIAVNLPTFQSYAPFKIHYPKVHTFRVLRDI